MPFRSHRFMQRMLDNTQRVMIDKYNQHRTYRKLPEHTLSPRLLKPSNAAVEWWYWTGHLNDDYGFEYCMFKLNPKKQRFGLVPMSSVHHNEWYSLHVAITDLKNDQFLARSSASYFHEPRMFQTPNGKIVPFSKLECSFKDLELQLSVEPLTNLLAHSQTGYLTTGGVHNLYVSYPRCHVHGEIKLNGKIVPVKGDAWFDHQKMAESHLPDLQGWDWFCGHVGDKNIMVYQTRGKHKGYHATVHGKHTTYTSNVTMNPKRFWTSPKTGARYPIEWEIIIDKKVYTVKSNVVNQELLLLHSPMAYYEGSVTWYEKDTAVGKGYMELVGYDKRLKTKIIETMVR